MAHFVVAGRSNDPEFARAEALGCHLAHNLPNFRVDIIMLPPPEWPDYQRTVYIQNGWDHRMSFDRKMKTPDQLDQMIWRRSGQLIGDTSDFVKLIWHAYRIQLNLPDSLLVEIAEENHRNLQLVRV
ncbi:uncharacterized protein BJ171DRAFT_538454 [Polychytrium aggregatum]|uniref:uncharacterized protein n=1 Tax=Polychytrium aggregatum TaxID=110093 RepID=UPI0022FF3605|nr:uncharacterized protein BJ171DRAFT_538454 [Polychytrium aggregatum]KAI9190861.1 hypothetical protein BJ171DRAFT_538454 [Polychytrium aggregatum]